jgi:hypothetical protein
MNAGQFERQRARIESQSSGRTDKWRKRAFQHLVREAGAEVVSSGRRITSYRLPNGQSVCHKRRFRCEGDALDTLRQIAIEEEPRKKPIRAYACYVCFGWHVTSQPR